jgi:hypothetical protein
MSVVNINGTLILYDNNPTYYIRDYYYYIINILNTILNDMHCKYNINLACNTKFISDKPEIKIHINYEHTLVIPGGRDTAGSPMGSIPVLDNHSVNYLVRLTEIENINNSDIIIEYSLPNCKNIEASTEYNHLFKKYIYIPPLLYPLNTYKQNRNIDILTTFINITEPRREGLLNKLQLNHLPHININTCFDKNSLQELYYSSKIIINIHQTEHHHTFEELRVLPALLCGVIVICENSPLKEHIPYKDYVVWSTYDKIIDITKDVLLNYKKYYALLFSDSKLDILNGIINGLNTNIIVELSKVLKQ